MHNVRHEVPVTLYSLVLRIYATSPNQQILCIGEKVVRNPIEQRNIKKLQDQILIDCRNLISGIYLCKMTRGKETLGSGKFVISK